MYKILSIDGGGIRGKIPAMILSEIEDVTGKPISSLFDLIIGTSTGGILAAGLTVPDTEGNPKYTAREIVSLYDRRGRDIFVQRKKGWINYLHSFFQEKYTNAGIEDVLAEYLGHGRISECVTPIMTTAYDIERRSIQIFESIAARKGDTPDFKLLDSVLSTAVAPTYFEPHFFNEGKKRYAMIDGGACGLNNPALLGVDFALSLGYKYNEISVLSLGTGHCESPYLYQKAKNWGLAEWVKPVIKIMMDGSSEVVDLHLSGRVVDYLRIQFALNKNQTSMDNATTRNLLRLEKKGADVIRDESKRIFDFVRNH